MFNTDNSGTYGWYFSDYMHIGGRIIDGEVSDACSVHVYDFKGYSTALSDNEIIQNYISSYIYSQLGPNENPNITIITVANESTSYLLPVTKSKLVILIEKSNANTINVE